jgi:hypothetical protein
MVIKPLREPPQLDYAKEMSHAVVAMIGGSLVSAHTVTGRRPPNDRQGPGRWGEGTAGISPVCTHLVYEQVS